MTPRWYEEGEEPDYRFTLANERTFLAWLRTALALLAGAVALNQLVPVLSVQGLRPALAALLAVAGTVLAAWAYRRWAVVQRAMRNSRGVPFTRLPVVAGWVAALAGVLVFVTVLGHAS